MEECKKVFDSDLIHQEYFLPEWRIKDLIGLGYDLLVSHGFNKPGFDLTQMVESYNITIYSYSTLTEECVQRFMQISKECLEYGFSPVTDCPQKQIFINCRDNGSITWFILLHEFSHLYLGHRQASSHAEMEAECLTLSIWIMLCVHKFLDVVLPKDEFVRIAYEKVMALKAA